jgi:pimeloyl-ACP methyl ester carboxylesterase
MQFAYQYPQRCERLVLVNSGGLGRVVTFYLRMLTLPGFESVLPLVCSPRLRDAGDRVASWLGGMGVPSTPARDELWRSFASLAEPENRRAFFRSLHEVIDFSGQAVSALSRLWRAARLPTLIVWGAEDSFIPVSHAIAAHEAISGSRLEIFEGVGHYPHCEAPLRDSSRYSSTSSPLRSPPDCRRIRPRLWAQQPRRNRRTTRSVSRGGASRP